MATQANETTPADRFGSMVALALGAGHLDDDDDQTKLTDLLADALHWCGVKGIDFDDALRMAREHHADEMANPDTP